MPTRRTELECKLFQLRLKDRLYDENGKDGFPELLESLRPHVKGDERIKAALLNCEPLAEMYVDGRAILELLLDELPGSPQVRFILNYYAFQPLGEDGMSTQSAHRIMAKRCPEDPWFRRQVIQFARGRHLGLEYSGVYYHSDLSDSDGDLLLDWALADARYLPRCLNGFRMDEVLRLLCRHSGFALEGYDFAGDWAALPGLFSQARNLATEQERLGFFATCKEVNESAQRQLLDCLAKDMQPENALELRAAADGPRQGVRSCARVLLLQNAAKSPLAWDWAQNHLAAQTEEPWWLAMLATDAPDMQWTLNATRKLLAQPDQGFRKFCVRRGLTRLCGGPWRLPVEQGLPLLQQALADNSLAEERPALLSLLGRAYPDHPETRRMLLAHGVLSALREVEGLTTDLVRLAVEQARLGKPSQGAIGILRDCREESAFKALIDLVEQNSPDAIQATALRALADGYGDRPEVKPLLVKHATLDEKRETTWNQALLALAWSYPDDPATRETLEQLASGHRRQAYRSRELLDYLADPDYSGWLRNREQRRSELKGALREESGDNHWKLHKATYELALWFGEEDETVELLLGRARVDGRSATPIGADPSSLQARRVAEARIAGAADCLRLAVMRWPGDPRIHEAVKAALHSPALPVREEAACLLSRAYSQDPQTVTLLRPLIGTSPVIFGEYLGLRMGEPEAMAEGVAAVQRLAEGGDNEPLALDGPLHLLRHFGPRKDLFGILARMGATTGNRALQKGISRALDQFFPGRTLKTLEAPIATDRITALQTADVGGADLARVRTMSESDPDDAVRLSAAEALFLRGPREVWPTEAVKELVRRGFQQALPLLGRMRAQDEATLTWLLEALGAAQALPNQAGPRGVLTETVADFFANTPRGRQYLVQRVHEAQEVEEFSTAVRALCALYHQDDEVRSLLDRHLLDVRLDGPTASELLKTQTARFTPSRKVDFYLSVLHAPQAPPTCEAQRVAPSRLSSLIACECHGEIALDDPEAKRVVAALIEVMERHSRETVRLHAANALLIAMSGGGHELEARFKLFPEAKTALGRWWAK